MNVSMFPQNLSLGEKVFVPVQQNLVIYANFKHVVGYPAQNNDGISIDKAFVLNSLIENLVMFGKKENEILTEFVGTEDEKIVQMQTEVARLAKIEPKNPYMAIALPRAGDVFSFCA